MFSSPFQCFRRSYGDMWQELCDSDFDLSYSYEFTCEHCVSAGEPDVGWDQFFEDNSNIFSSVETCEDIADTMRAFIVDCFLVFVLLPILYVSLLPDVFQKSKEKYMYVAV